MDVKQLIAISWLVLGGRLAVQAAWAGESPDGIWRDSGASPGFRLAEPLQGLLHYRLVELNPKALHQTLTQLHQARAPEQGPLELTVPLPEGGFLTLGIRPTQVMAPELAARYPDILTFKGEGVDSPAAWGRFDWSPLGFHGMAEVDGQMVYINPHNPDLGQYLVFNRSDLQRPPPDFVRERPTDAVFPEGYEKRKAKAATSAQRAATGGTKRRYRLAVATTGEYTAYHGGTVSLGQSAVVAAINRVDGIYEREFAVNLQLVANNDQLIFTDAASDPYSNNDGKAMLAQNQTTLDDIIGGENYDVGHVFSTGGGGRAMMGSLCWQGYHAQGVTGSSVPTGDPFWVDYVAHELGHQFDANHTYNGSQESCNTRNAATAYEPGSGSTIMGYAGICGSDNLQANTDPWMHAASLDEISAFVFTGYGLDCGTPSDTGNTPPSVNVGNGGFSIPASTPFTLTGSATDAEGDSLSYSWEQFDLGPTAPLGSASGSSPLFRSFPPLDSPSRTFPRWSDLLANTSSASEILPDYSRELNFRLTVRDNRGGVNAADIAFSVTADAGPFRLTYPNSALSLAGGSQLVVTWDPANTAAPPVNCTSVDILLSTDGGDTFATHLASATPNDGTETLTLPDLNASASRLMLACSNNIFFDISDQPFTITSSTGTDCNGENVTVDSTKPFPANKTTACSATTSITTSGEVLIPASAKVTFSAPLIQLNAGFHAANGADFQARQ